MSNAHHEFKPSADSQTLAVRASGVTINCRPDGVIEIYVSERRFSWRVLKVWRGYETIVITPNREPAPEPKASEGWRDKLATWVSGMKREESQK